jgi:hypothetical protein
MYAYYSYAYYIGAILVTNDKINTNKDGAPYNAGDILSCFLGVSFGIYALGMATPNIKAISEGQVAG